MANATLTQAEADSLLAMEKHRVDDKVWSPPHRGGSVTVPFPRCPWTAVSRSSLT